MQNIDYTVDAQGRVVAGDRGKVRQFTEYWTLLRGKEAHGVARSDRACPSCGAPLDHINMAGNCGSCGVKLTTGSFDWVLSRIEQDEVYTG
jgi:ribosomal protein S27AE